MEGRRVTKDSESENKDKLKEAVREELASLDAINFTWEHFLRDNKTSAAAEEEERDVSGAVKKVKKFKREELWGGKVLCLHRKKEIESADVKCNSWAMIPQAIHT